MAGQTRNTCRTSLGLAVSLCSTCRSHSLGGSLSEAVSTCCLRTHTLTHNVIAVDLSSTTRLRTLHLSHIRIDGSQPRLLYIPDPVPLKTYEWVPAALARLASPLLTQIHFSIELVKGGDLGVLEWDAIDAHLARLARSASGLVTTFHVGNADHAGLRCSAVDAVMYHLPRLRTVEGRVGVVYTHGSKVEECWFP